VFKPSARNLRVCGVIVVGGEVIQMPIINRGLDGKGTSLLAPIKISMRHQGVVTPQEHGLIGCYTLRDSLYFHLRSPAGTTTEHCLHFTGQDMDQAVLLPLSAKSFSEDASQNGHAKYSGSLCLGTSITSASRILPPCP